MNIIDTIESEGMRKDLPEIAIGDQVKVFVKVIEGNRERLQSYEGIVIAKKNGGIRETIVVRRVTFGVGVERSFPLNCLKLVRIEVVRHGKVRSAKLYYLRERTGKSAKLKETR